ncbi:Putative Lipopolysaccharide biosynthesis protein-like [Candidatus Glomeribacter gigasporarum BEG34]|uniref:Putative Lipopolysaccharide biosynthesis protein-like n=1 Tax=Candidatus Glomeribacter gigasporarum BEG34 TaxID=1070319 RepID=G2J9X0_9BURK|nr:LPS biosynthesis protein [Candidatus Glomeribacter gigasporarum]CCD29567.1 Putative Lipopolysaccharide biosynthesis protein-like [Candidatus Glomeribacter gigasporarum BEG34]
MHKLISKRFAQLIYFSGIHRLLCAVQDRLVYWLRDYWKKSHLIVLGEKKSNRLAIFSIYQLSDLSVFIESQLDYLIKLGYDVAVAVPHELRQADQDYLDQRCRFRIMRQNVGRDFGSYKDAILKVGFDRISEYQRVLLINDSIFFPMGDTGAFEKIFFASRSDVIGLCENTDYHRHISSFFIDIDTKVFCQQEVKQYWEKYKPYNSRLYVIRKGECYFSRVLYKSARSIDILYSKEKVINDLISFFESSGAIQYYPFFYLLCDVYFYPIKKTFINNRKISIEMIRLVFIDFLRKILESSSNPHSFGIPLVMICHAPFLKRDLYYREMVDLAQLALMFDILQYPFKEQTLFEYRRRGSLSNQTLFRQVMIQIGVL